MEPLVKLNRTESGRYTAPEDEASTRIENPCRHSQKGSYTYKPVAALAGSFQTSVVHRSWESRWAKDLPGRSLSVHSIVNGKVWWAEHGWAAQGSPAHHKCPKLSQPYCHWGSRCEWWEEKGKWVIGGSPAVLSSRKTEWVPMPGPCTGMSFGWRW